MQICYSFKDIKDKINQFKEHKQKISLVPTMGFLHQGHLSLVKESIKFADKTVVSIFVNPLQFGPNEDFKKYPRDHEKDLKLLEDAGVDLVYIPKEEDFYPQGFNTRVYVNELSGVLCGKSRQGHFEGVCTVVLKLLNIVCPDYMFMGQKDAQQVVVLDCMIKDLNLNVKLVRMPIIREKNGLAMSSRNSYLSSQAKNNASVIYKALSEARDAINKGEKLAQVIKDKIQEILTTVKDLKIDYIEIVDYNTLQPINLIKSNTLIAVAVYIEKTRLIDNIII